MRHSIFFYLIFLFTLVAEAQIIEPIKWSFDSKQEGKNAELIFTANIDEGWHLYDTRLPEGGPLPTQIVYEDSSLFEFVSRLEKQPLPIEKFDKTFQMDLSYFVEKAVLTQKIKLLKDAPFEINGYVVFMGCDDEVCLPPNEIEFSFSFTGQETGTSVKTVLKESDEISTTDRGSATGQSLWLFVLISAIAGLAAVLTPCVFPMIPMTVSFFMRGKDHRRESIRNGLFFGFSIVSIYTLLGALFSFGVFGPNTGNILSTHWIPNLLFFILFFVFALSFFGAFEIILPGSLVNKTDSKADKGGITGAFFMALTTVIVSFSCTGPFIGALIIEAVQDGGIRPLIGMFFFGLAFAAPFTLLALFPSALSKLPKSGGWLNSVKVVFAFILLAFGLKFLSNIDQVYGFQVINRDVYIAIWIVIFALMGFYFLGNIRFSHDSQISHISTGRLLLAIVAFTFVIYLGTGLLGAPLTSISALLPPQSAKITYNSEVNANVNTGIVVDEACEAPKYADKFHLPHGLKGYFDYEQGMECAKKLNKPAFVVFKGHACANCKKMENTVWADPEVLKILSDEYMIIGLYTDDRSSLPENEWITSAIDGKIKKTIGKKNLDLLIRDYNTNSIPFHVIIDPAGEKHKLGVTFNNDEFRSFLEKGL